MRWTTEQEQEHRSEARWHDEQAAYASYNGYHEEARLHEAAAEAHREAADAHADAFDAYDKRDHENTLERLDDLANDASIRAERADLASTDD
jgi:hypothetical protein